VLKNEYTDKVKIYFIFKKTTVVKAYVSTAKKITFKI
jgi:hypothetical protein